MFNIITNQINADIKGVSKVFVNLCKGLEKIKFPYVVNYPLNYCERIYVQDNRRPLPYLKKLKYPSVIGPNIFAGHPDRLLRKHFPENSIYLQPCEWAKECCETIVRFPNVPIKVWPVGIDTEEFYHFNGSAKKNILVYHKMRSKNELNKLLTFLSKNNFKYQLINYGSYNQSEYIEALKKTRFIIWHGRHESQGIALQEALSTNTPILTWDVKKLNEEVGGINWGPEFDELQVTAAPYFDERCGLKIYGMDELPKAIEFMNDNLNNFAPRQFIFENLSLEKQAYELLRFYDFWNFKITHKDKELTISKKWKEWDDGSKPIRYLKRTIRKFRKNIASPIKQKIKRYVQ